MVEHPSSKPPGSKLEKEIKRDHLLKRKTYLIFKEDTLLFVKKKDILLYLIDYLIIYPISLPWGGDILTP